MNSSTSNISERIGRGREREREREQYSVVVQRSKRWLDEMKIICPYIFTEFSFILFSSLFL